MTYAASALDAVSCLRVSGAGPARGFLTVPGDKSISHRAVLMSAMANGSSVITGLSLGQDVQHTLRAVERFGVLVTEVGEGRVRVEGPIRHEPDDVLDHGNAGTGIRLTSGVFVRHRAARRTDRQRRRARRQRPELLGGIGL